jgi:addiction module HigA family antidote
MTFKNGMRPVHPGEVLRKEYLKPLGLSANALAKALRLSPSRISDIVPERRGVTADTDVRLARYFGGTAQFWLILQSIYVPRTAERSAETKHAPREIALSTQQNGQTFPRKRIFTTIREIRCKLWIYNEKVGRLGLEPRTKALKGPCSTN